MKLSLLAVLLCAALAAASLGAAPPAATAPAATAPAAPPTAFTAEIEAHFAAWDKNADGILEPAELDALVTDRQLTGKAAAALGALKAAQRGAKIPLPPITLDYFHTYERQVAEHKHPIPNFDRSFGRALKKISSPKRELLSGQQPTLDTCHQGPLGDCFFVAVVGAAVARDPAAVQKMIATAADGSFLVAFADGRHACVAPLTDAEIALTSTTGDNGLWLPILEKAYGSIRTAALAQDKQSGSTTDAIAHGGSSGKSIELLTGHTIDHFSLRPPTPKPPSVLGAAAKSDHKDTPTSTPPPSATQRAASTAPATALAMASATSPVTGPTTALAKAPAPPLAIAPATIPATAPAPIDPALLAKHLAEVLPKVRAHLVSSIHDHRLISAGTPKDGKMPPGISSNHSYAILGYDPGPDTLALWNPHGNTFTPKGNPGPNHGYPTQSGHFTMPLTDFAHVFTGISFETDKPLPAKQ